MSVSINPVLGAIPAPGQYTTIRSVTASYAVTGSDGYVLADATAGVVTVTLPPPASGRVVAVKKTDVSANAVTVSRNASETIDGASSKALSEQYQAATFVSNGTNWFVFA